jgi:hypothetical protein
MGKSALRPLLDRLEFRPHVEELETRLPPGNLLASVLNPVSVLASSAPFVARDSLPTATGNVALVRPASASLASAAPASPTTDSSTAAPAVATPPAPQQVALSDGLSNSLGSDPFNLDSLTQSPAPDSQFMAGSLDSHMTTQAVSGSSASATTAPLTSGSVVQSTTPVQGGLANAPGLPEGYLSAMAAGNVIQHAAPQSRDAYLHTVIPYGTNLAMHEAYKLKIFVDGQRITIPEGIGVEADGILPIHTQCTCGVIHEESTTIRQFYLQDFFKTWGQTFNSHDVLGHEIDSSHFMYMTVNGKISHAFGALPVHQGDVVEIHYGEQPPPINPLDDTVSLGILTGSFLQIQTFTINFGDDQGSAHIDNINIADDGTLLVNQGDIYFPPFDFTYQGFMVTIQVRAQSDAAGSYDRSTGNAGLSFAFDAHVTSNAPNFDNDHCVLPTVSLNLSTDNGTPFLDGVGTVADNTFVADAFPMGACGSFFGTDYASLLNSYAHLPSLNPGDNVLSLNVLMTPALLPLSGVRPFDDTVNLGILPGSFINVMPPPDGFHVDFGSDPPDTGLNNVTIADDGTFDVAQSDISLGSKTFDLGSGITATAELRAQSDAIGTYDRDTGSATMTITLDVHVTSNAPFFDNDNCIVPAVDLTLSTDNDGGAQFSGGQGTVVDNTFVVQAIPVGACGNVFGTDYAGIVNGFIHAPSLNPGDNAISLNLRMDPALPPS